MGSPPAPPHVFSDRRAATALEFALVCVPLLVFILAVVQMGLHFYWQQTLDYAVQQAGRQVQIGRIGSSYTSTAFANQVLCPAFSASAGCSDLFVDLHPVSDYQRLTASGVQDAPDSTSTTGLVFCTGQPGQQMYAHVVFMAPSFIGSLLGTGDFDSIVANAAFTNENPAGATVVPANGC